MRDLLVQLPALMILLEYCNAHNPLWGSKKMNTRGRVQEKILDEYNLLYYRAHNGWKSTIDTCRLNDSPTIQMEHWIRTRGGIWSLPHYHERWKGSLNQTTAESWLLFSLHSIKVINDYKTLQLFMDKHNIENTVLDIFHVKWQPWYL